MKVEVKPFQIRKKVTVGGGTYEVEQAYDQARVFVDGEQVGLTMTDPNDTHYQILHPLSKGYPLEFLELVVKNSNGKLRGTLNGPVPAAAAPGDEDEAI